MANDVTTLPFYHTLQTYVPQNQQEEKDLPILLHHLLHSPHVFTRQNQVAHFTASAWVVDPTRTKVLMAYHNLYQSWAWLGGHADGETDLANTAIREAKEESGLSEVRLLSNAPLSVEILPVQGHERKGVYVPSHLHLNVTYLLEADPCAMLCNQPEENSKVGWLPMEALDRYSSEPWFCERIYSKLNERVQREFGV